MPYKPVAFIEILAGAVGTLLTVFVSSNPDIAYLLTFLALFISGHVLLAVDTSRP